MKIEYLGFWCEHLAECSPADGLFLEPKVKLEVSSEEEKIVVGMKGVCLASRRNGGKCNHDCTKITITKQNPILHAFRPDRAEKAGIECTNKIRLITNRR